MYYIISLSFALIVLASIAITASSNDVRLYAAGGILFAAANHLFLKWFFNSRFAEGSTYRKLYYTDKERFFDPYITKLKNKLQ